MKDRKRPNRKRLHGLLAIAVIVIPGSLAYIEFSLSDPGRTTCRTPATRSGN